MEVSDAELLRAAYDMIKNAYAPYSHFKVGAALVAEDSSGNKKVFTGCNIETSTFTPTVCAERVAVSDAVKNGFCRIVKIAVCGGMNGEIKDFCPPCGVCRQVISEFGDKNTYVVLTDGKSIEKYTLEALLPLAFKKSNLL